MLFTAVVSPNFLFYFISKYKKRHPYKKVVFEIGDMWPETLPFNGKKKTLFSPLTKIWASIRDNSLQVADGIVFECRLFFNNLRNYTKGSLKKVIYLSKVDYFSERDLKVNPVTITKKINFLYIGALNNIVDIDLIVLVLKEVSKFRELEFHIIGAGEKKKNYYRSVIEIILLHIFMVQCLKKIKNI